MGAVMVQDVIVTPRMLMGIRAARLALKRRMGPHRRRRRGYHFDRIIECRPDPRTGVMLPIWEYRRRYPLS